MLAMSHTGLVTTAKTAALAMIRTPSTNRPKISQLITAPGMAAARLLARSSSHVRMGVASSGSRLLASFSPTML